MKVIITRMTFRLDVEEFFSATVSVQAPLPLTRLGPRCRGDPGPGPLPRPQEWTHWADIYSSRGCTDERGGEWWMTDKKREGSQRRRRSIKDY